MFTEIRGEGIIRKVHYVIDKIHIILYSIDEQN